MFGLLFTVTWGSPALLSGFVFIFVSFVCSDTDISFATDLFQLYETSYGTLKEERVLYHQCRVIESKLYIRIYQIISVCIY